ncbi:DNA recombination protein RmuC [Candidatus Gracilibacteria bacterium]|nr:DNA recombination protein RmuC [Candidatus Gracilibacteria bacterium]
MELTDILLIALFVLVGGGLGFVIFKITTTSQKSPEEMKRLLEEFQKDKESRFRESESLRNELRESSKGLREEFHRVNQTVDTKLSESAKQLNERLDKSSNVIGNLQKELGKMGEIGSKIENLDKILRAPKGRGGMGEENLEEILRSVFPANLWERQYSLGTGLVVDAVVKTSNGLIPIDAKFPLPAFERIVQAENDEALLKAQKEFQKDVKVRIDEVSKYIRPEKNTLGFALLFLPNENVYYEAAIRSGEISEYAKKKKVLLTGPNTMLYVLQMLFQAYQSQEFAREAQRALAELSGVRKQAERLDEEIGILAKHIGNANSKVADVQGANLKLQGQIDKVSALEEGITPQENESDKLL